MRSILDQLESNEAVLLMYLADELPAADRVEIDKRLVADAALRAELETLRSAHETMSQSFAALDASKPLPGTAAAATERRLSRVFRQWHADQMRMQAQQPVRVAAWRRFGWAYPWAAAAVIVIGYIVWWGTQPASDTSLPGGVVQNDYDNTGGYNWRPPSTQDVLVDAEKQSLADAEKDLETVSYLRELTVTQ